MSIVVSSNFVLTETDTSLTEDHPIVGWRNIITTSNIAADTADTDYPVTNLANPATHLKWLAGTSVLQYVTITTGTADELDYVAIARHNLATAGIAISIEGDDGGGYETLVSPTVLADDGPALFRFTPGAFSAVRLKLAAGSEPASIAVAYLGKLLVLPRKLYQGMTPINYGRVSRSVSGRSEAGHFLGRIVTQEFVQNKVPLSLITPAYYRDNIDAFVEASKTTPFFFGWRPETYPDELGYCNMTNEPVPVNESPHGLISMTLEMTGVI